MAKELGRPQRVAQEMQKEIARKKRSLSSCSVKLKILVWA